MSNAGDRTMKYILFDGGEDDEHNGVGFVLISINETILLTIDIYKAPYPGIHPNALYTRCASCKAWQCIDITTHQA